MSSNSIGPAVIIAFVLWFLFSIWKNRASSANGVVAELERATDEIGELRKKVIVVAGGNIPGREVKAILGHVTGTSNIGATNDEEAETAEILAMMDLMRRAQAMGANAVLDARLTTSTHEQDGSGWMVSKAYYTGTAVTI
ncbi:heavy metal-binding domain-containing protein [Geomonas subterranea]|uniref:heavy metal-binding domain-containing protein n=1 Tax=Geomonas subterranea TaxID=2847989 RepID=UPI001CD30381|nr:heavy metal-binding domain-containing protein [Geomonas fuzhouensis]